MRAAQPNEIEQKQQKQNTREFPVREDYRSRTPPHFSAFCNSSQAEGADANTRLRAASCRF